MHPSRSLPSEENKKTGQRRQVASPAASRYNEARTYRETPVANARHIVDTLLADPKIAENSNLAPALYRDQPILLTASQMRNFTPPRIRAMRAIAKPTHSEARIFYEQGMFMRDYEDDIDFREEVVRYFPTYQALTDAQLRGYFSWRTQWRKGDRRKTSLSFAFMHIYELLNGIGAATPEDAFHALRNFWSAYRELDSGTDKYVTLWLKDFVIYHNLEKSLLDGLPDVVFDNALGILLHYKTEKGEDVFSALNSLSRYNLEASRFFRERPEETRNAALRVFDAISQYYNRNPKNTAREKLFGRVVTNSYPMFRSAVFYDQRPPEDRIYEVGDSHRYLCRGGVWSCERFVGYGLNNKKIGAILKTVDFLLRERNGFKSTLQPGKLNKVLRGKIEKALEKYAQEQRENAAPVVAIDLSKLGGIREAARATRDRLLVDGDEPSPEHTPDREKARAPDPAERLDETERAFLRGLLAGGSGDAVARAAGLPSSVLVDRINEKCFDLLGDTALVDGDGGMEIVEDYRTALEGLAPQ